MAVRRITSIPGVTVLPFWQAKYRTTGGMVSYDAIVWHFAQGGGTDSWLLHPTGDNSSHIVLKYSGAIRQMVDFADAAHSLHISRPDGPPGTGDYGIFSLDAAQAALGDGWRDPNTQIITIEVEGFASSGANADQLETIPRLARWLEEQFPRAVHLGHRDFQNYKPCPGPTLFRGLLPHGGRLTTGQENELIFIETERLPYGGRYVIPANKEVIGIKIDRATGAITKKVWAPRATASSASYDATITTNATRGNPYIRATDGYFAGWLISAGQVDEVPNPAPQPTDTTPFTQADLDAAVAAAVAPLKAALAAERQDDATTATALRKLADEIAA